MHASTSELQTKAVELLAQRYSLQLSAEQHQELEKIPYLSVDVRQLPAWLQAPLRERQLFAQGIPYSAADNQLAALLQAANQASLSMHSQQAIVCLRLDKRLPAAVVMPFLQQLQTLGVNHAILITEQE